MFNKIVSNSRKTLESFKTRKNAFNNTHKRLFFKEFSVSFQTIFGKFENQQKTFFQRIVSKLSEYFRFCHVRNHLLTQIAHAVPSNTEPSFFAHGPRKLVLYFKTSGLVFHRMALPSGW